MTAGRPSNGRRSVRRWSSTRPMISTPAEMVPGDFGDYFTDCDYPTQVSTYKLAEGTDIENEVTVLQGEEEGPTIYIVAGVHGDEIAGWMTGQPGPGDRHPGRDGPYPVPSQPAGARRRTPESAM